MHELDPTLVQRVRSVGVRAASVVDLIAIGFARRESDVPSAERAARDMLARFRSLRGLSEISKIDLMETAGLEEFEALRTQALMEIGRRSANAGQGPKETIDSAKDIIDLLDHLRYEKREHFLAVLLDAKNRLMRIAVIHVGTLTESIVGPREVFREAIKDGASSMVVVHNHPSGDPTPSPQDVQVTKRLVEIGLLLDIPVVDHVILGEKAHFSFAEHGLMRA